MAKRTGPQNIELISLIRRLKKTSTKENIKLWKRIAQDLEKPTRKRRTANIYKINKFTRDGEIAIVPGKVLSMGDLTKKITIAAYQFSETAKDKLKNNAITIDELIDKNPKGKNVRIIG